MLAHAQSANSHHIAAKKAEADHRGQHQAHQHAEAMDAAVVLDKTSSGDSVGGESNCCTMCITFDNVAPVFVATAFQVHHRIVDFKIGGQLLIGHLVALDPDIPKTIV